MTPNLPIKESFNIFYKDSGEFFNNIFYGSSPSVTSLNILEGSNNFSSINLEKGSSFSEGSITISSFGPDSKLQVYRIDTQELIFSVSMSPLLPDNITDFD